MPAHTPAHARPNSIYETQRRAANAMYEQLSGLEDAGLLKRTVVRNGSPALLLHSHSYALNEPQRSRRAHASQQLLSVLHTPSGETLFIGEISSAGKSNYFVSRLPYEGHDRATLVGIIETGQPFVAANPRQADRSWRLSFLQPAGTADLYIAQEDQPQYATIAFSATNSTLEGTDEFPVPLWAPITSEIAQRVGQQAASELTMITGDFHLIAPDPELTVIMSRDELSTAGGPRRHQ